MCKTSLAAARISKTIPPEKPLVPTVPGARLRGIFLLMPPPAVDDWWGNVSAHSPEAKGLSYTTEGILLIIEWMGEEGERKTEGVGVKGKWGRD